MLKVEHIGIAVEDLDLATELYSKLLNRSPYKEEAVESEGVITSFFQVGETKIELLEGTSDDSPISRFISRKGPGMHHVAYEVEDIKAEMKRLSAEGFTLLSEEPKLGADNKLVCFVHPKSANGVLVEICQEIA